LERHLCACCIACLYGVSQGSRSSTDRLRRRLGISRSVSPRDRRGRSVSRCLCLLLPSRFGGGGGLISGGNLLGRCSRSRSSLLLLSQLFLLPVSLCSLLLLLSQSCSRCRLLLGLPQSSSCRCFDLLSP
jgi:hypothetical protein